MMHYYPRNPYRYATAGHFPQKADNRMTKTQKTVVAICWTISLVIIGIKAYHYYFPFGM